jgi:ribonuclease BN (tRNA processing enzyme)
MKIHILGAGNFSSVKHHNTSFIIQPDFGGKENSLMFDVGRDVKFSLAQSQFGWKPSDIFNAFISHQHGDHLAGIDYLLTMNYFNPTAPRVKLYFHKSMLAAITKVIEVFMETFEDARLPKDASGRPRRVLLTDVCEPVILEDNEVFWIGELEYSLVQSMHVVTGGMFMPCFGLKVRQPKKDDKEEKIVFFTGDTQFCPSQLLGAVMSSTMTVTDCETCPAAYKSGVHAHVDDWESWAEAARQKLIMTHYGDNVDDAFIKKYEGIFKGFAKKGDVIEV